MAGMQFPTLTDEEKNKALAESLMVPVAPVTPTQVLAPEFTPPVKTTTTSKVMPTVATDAFAQMGAADSQIAAAQGNIINAEADQAKAELDLRKQADESLMLAQAQDQKRLEENQKLVSQNRADIDAKVQEYSQLKPVDFWAKRDTADKVTMGLAIILGGIAQGFGAKDNAALKIMGDAINQDMQSQQLLMQQKLQAIDNSRRSLEDKRAERSAILAAGQARNEAALQQVKRQVEMLGLQTTSAVAKDKIAIMTAGLDQKLAERQAEYAKNFVTTITKEETIAGKGNIPFDSLPKNNKEVIDVIGKKNGALGVIKAEIDGALQQLQDPKLSQDDKIRIGQGLVKTLNSTQGSDAVGAEEAKRLAVELSGNVDKVAEKAIQYGGYGAAGGALSGVGALAGGGLGLVGGAILGAIDAANDPGGIRFSPDIGGFTQRVKLTADKLQSTLDRNDMVAKLVGQGIEPSKAAALAEQQLQKRFQKGN